MMIKTYFGSLDAYSTLVGIFFFFFFWNVIKITRLVLVGLIQVEVEEGKEEKKKRYLFIF